MPSSPSPSSLLILLSPHHLLCAKHRVHANEKLLTQIMAGEVHVNDVVPPEKKVKAQK